MDNRSHDSSFGKENSTGKKALGEERPIEGIQGAIGYIPKVDRQLFLELSVVDDAGLEQQIVALRKQLNGLIAEAMRLHKEGKREEKHALIRSQQYPIEDKMKTIEAMRDIRDFRKMVKNSIQLARTDEDRDDLQKQFDNKKKELEKEYGIEIA